MDTNALVERLKKGDIVAAMDVFDKEPLEKNHPLRKLPNALLTPHRAGGLMSSRGPHPDLADRRSGERDGGPKTAVRGDRVDDQPSRRLITSPREKPWAAAWRATHRPL